MDESTDNLSRAREAYAAQDWVAAAAYFDAVVPGPLSADDIAAYADAVWWLGRIDDTLRLGAAAYDAFLADSRPADAAQSATVLGIFHMARGDEPQAAGWLGRASRLAKELPESVAHGYLLNFTAVEASLIAGQPGAAADAARQLQELGRRIDAPAWSRSA